MLGLHQVQPENLHSVLAIGRKSYVHRASVIAFEDGILERCADAMKRSCSLVNREQILAQIVASAPAG